MHKISFIQSHPIQYYSPLYDCLEKDSSVEFKMYYCSDYGLSKDGKRYHPEFGELPNWNVDLVEGHNHEVLRNRSLKKGIFNGFFGLMNFSIYRKLKKDRPDVLVIVGWHYFTFIWAVICCKLLHIKVYVRGDNSIDGDMQLSKLKRAIKHFAYGKLLFPLYTKITYVGVKNKLFYESYGVKDTKLIHMPHAVDNKRFRDYFNLNQQYVGEVRRFLEIPNKFSVLFIGRLHEEKRILDLIEAIASLGDNVHLTIVGDGKIYDDVEKACNIYNKDSFKLVGFKNQGELLNYYLTADLFVLPSQLETWGLVVNEAMNFNLPIIVSDTVGCGLDLCRDQNGFIFKRGDVKSLTSRIDYLSKNPNIAKQMGVESGELIKDYSYQAIIENLIESLKH